MSKNVLIVSSSPRKGGNSDTLCDQFMQGAEEAGNRVDKIRLAYPHTIFCLQEQDGNSGMKLFICKGLKNSRSGCIIYFI